jgi:hypothetical protein
VQGDSDYMLAPFSGAHRISCGLQPSISEGGPNMQPGIPIAALSASRCRSLHTDFWTLIPKTDVMTIVAVT